MNRNAFAMSAPVWIATLTIAATLLIVAPAIAHEGHAGPPKAFVEDKEALKSMLPDGARVAKRKQELDKESVQWAAEFYGVDLVEGVQTYYLARDKESGKVLGAAIISEADYRHGKVRIAIGINDGQHVTRAAVLGVNEKYIKDIESSSGIGYLDGYTGVSLAEFTDATNEAVSRHDAGQIVAQLLRDNAVLLVTLLRKVGE
jgi:hypothetical protein